MAGMKMMKMVLEVERMLAVMVIVNGDDDDGGDDEVVNDGENVGGCDELKLLVMLMILVKQNETAILYS